MQRPVFPKGRSLGGSSDLTLQARIKPGFIESLESVTYKTRIKRVLESLHGSRISAHEFQAARLLSDAVERVGAIQSVRVAVLEPQDQVLLAVTFDGSWESYIRVLWHKVGTLLDLIFCGTEDYVTAFDHSFEQWRAWAERVQVETGFFYGPPDATARDVLVHRRLDAMERRGEGGALSQVRAVLPSAEERVQAILHPDHGTRPNDEPPVKLPGNFMLTQHEGVKAGLQGLAGLYRLADLHRPGTPDGEVLRRASVDLLREFVELWAARTIDPELEEAARSRFGRPMRWLFPDGKAQLNVRQGLPPDATDVPDPLPAAVLADVQAGIVRPLPKVTHGALLLLRFEDQRAAGRFLRHVLPKISPGDAEPGATPEHPVCTLAFTAAGLQQAGLDGATWEQLPESFRQGMAARAGLLGDVHNNHPRRWRLPRRGLGPWRAEPEASQVDEVPMELVHAVLQLRCAAPGVPAGAPLHSDEHPLARWIADFCARTPGTELLSGQAMVKLQASGERSVEHFGYVDGMGQPDIEPGPGGDANRIHLGEVLLGHAHAGGPAPDPADPTLPQAQRRLIPYTRNGSFLVVRKYRQFVRRLEQAVEAGARQLATSGEPGAPTPPLDQHRELVYAKLMGRDREGRALATGNPGNRFDYERDPQGSRCPLGAHIRLAHPRRSPEPGARPPRLMRRGMSYGPPHTQGQDDDHVDRGLFFMAYNASLSEQFEVVQRWLAGANPTGASSLNSCPFVGVPDNGLTRQFRFEHPFGGQPAVATVPLEAQSPLFEEPLPLTRLEWGLYLFAPSLTALHLLAEQAVPPGQSCPWHAARGRELLTGLTDAAPTPAADAARQAWKGAIEDPESLDRLDSAALWAAIREDHGGVLDTPYGVLVASRELQHQVLRDPHRRYSIRGQFERMLEGIGPIYLGMDPGPDYDEQASVVNDAILALASRAQDREDTYAIALRAAQAKLDQIRQLANDRAFNIRSPRWDTSFDAREFIDEVVAALCEDWFGIQGSEHFVRGSVDWLWQDDQPPVYPGHFTALSRYMFQPNPGPMPRELSQRYSVALVRAMRRFVADTVDKGRGPLRADGRPAPIAQAIFGHPTKGTDLDWVARTMVGVMMGFVAPLTGALINVLREWQRDGRLWELRNRLSGEVRRDAVLSVLEAPLLDALRMRPMPQLLWRTATRAHRLGPPGPHAVDVPVGRTVVLALSSGTQQSLEDGVSDGLLMFGGHRVPGTAHPTHACPGYASATDAMLGALAALLSRPENLRSSSALLGFRLEGRTARPPGRPDHARARDAAGGSDAALPAPPPAVERDWPSNREGLVVAIGDSWLDSPYPRAMYDGSDLRQELMGFGWDMPKGLVSYRLWGTAKTLHDRLPALRTALKKQVTNRPDGQPFIGVLLSAGGNDSTKERFAELLDEHDPAQPDRLPLNPVRLAGHIEMLADCYRVVLRGIREEVRALGEDVPVLVHGYDYSQFPPTQAFPPAGDDSWFHKPLASKGHTSPSSGVKALRQLIGAFNDMLVTLVDQDEFKPFVRYVPLVDTIQTHWPNHAVDMWIDALHVRRNALRLMALKLDAELMKARAAQAQPRNARA